MAPRVNPNRQGAVIYMFNPHHKRTGKTDE